MELFKLLGTIAIDNGAANKALDETSEKGNKAQSKLSTAFGAIGKGATVVGKAIGTAMVAGGVAVTGLVTKSVQAYAEYEQLVGGVETLFGNSAEKVLTYAEKAYQTAGLSANAYMETVTSFSASLLQSLDGDTVKAADAADQAIIDMSDNANKMGTSMESIQNAYQGFAKQNYTMLDNLKLGYGGTKEEMQRLIDDANKVKEANGEMADLSIDSFADVTEAIHIVQTEMGITGTTAKEASTTISGSVSSMKSSWENLLVAVSSGSGDVGKYISNFVDSVATVGKNLLPVVSTALQGVVQLVSTLAPLIVAEIPGLISQLLPSVISAITGLVNAIVSALPSLIDMLLTSGIPQLLAGVLEIANVLISALPELISLICSALPTLLPMLIDAVVSLIVTIASNLMSIIQPIIDILPELIISICDAILSNLPVLLSAAWQLILGICAALPQLWDALVAAVEGAFTLICSYLGEWLAPVWEAVSEWFNDVKEKVSEWFSNAWDRVSQLFEKVVTIVKTGFKLVGSIISAAFQIITLPFRFIWENCKEYVYAAWEWIKGKISTAISKVKDIVKTGFEFVQEKIITPITNAKNKAVAIFENIRSNVQSKITALKDKVSSIFNTIRSKIETPINNAKAKVVSVIETLKSNITSKITAIKNDISSKFNDIKTKMTKPIEDAKTKIKSIVDTVKGFFSNLNITFPKIKLPHFSISPSGWSIGDLLEGTIPSLSIEWYAKAMKKPIIMNSPTIFGYDAATGSLMGGGEAGSEVVSGTDTLMQMIGNAVEAKMSAANQQIINLLTAMLATMEGGNKDLLQALLAGHTIKINEREFARTVREYA